MEVPGTSPRQKSGVEAGNIRVFGPIWIDSQRSATSFGIVCPVLMVRPRPVLMVRAEAGFR